jgi:hypothetical protein
MKIIVAYVIAAVFAGIWEIQTTLFTISDYIFQPAGGQSHGVRQWMYSCHRHTSAPGLSYTLINNLSCHVARKPAVSSCFGKVILTVIYSSFTSEALCIEDTGIPSYRSWPH